MLHKRTRKDKRKAQKPLSRYPAPSYISEPAKQKNLAQVFIIYCAPYYVGTPKHSTEAVIKIPRAMLHKRTRKDKRKAQKLFINIPTHHLT